MSTASIPIPGSLPPPTVWFPGDAFETSTVNFEPLPERRREVRYPTYEEVRVSVLDAAGVDMSGVLRDVSRSGFRVDLRLPVKTGARVKVSIRDKVVIFATARYCRREKYTFQVGASIDAMFCPAALSAARTSTPHASGTSELESREVARAIIEDLKLFPRGGPEPLANRRFAADPVGITG